MLRFERIKVQKDYSLFSNISPGSLENDSIMTTRLRFHRVGLTVFDQFSNFSSTQNCGDSGMADKPDEPRDEKRKTALDRRGNVTERRGDGRVVTEQKPRRTPPSRRKK